MTSSTTTTDEIIDLLAKYLFVEVDDAHADLIDQGLIDSLGFTTLFLLLEQHFGVAVQLDDMDVDNFRSPRRIEAFISKRAGPG